MPTTNNKIKVRGTVFKNQYDIKDLDSGEEVNISKQDLENLLGIMEGKEECKGKFSDCLYKVKDDMLILVNPVTKGKVRLTKDEITGIVRE